MQYECRLCLTLHNNEGNYLAHTQVRHASLPLSQALELQAYPVGRTNRFAGLKSCISRFWLPFIFKSPYILAAGVIWWHVQHQILVVSPASFKWEKAYPAKADQNNAPLLTQGICLCRACVGGHRYAKHDAGLESPRDTLMVKSQQMEKTISKYV